MTAREFERGYAERSGVTVAWLHRHGLVVRPCFCDFAEEKHWQVVNRKEWERDQRIRQKRLDAYDNRSTLTTDIAPA